MTGQDAVGVAESFAEAAEFDGVVMTKLDGDARGGAALSVKAVTGKPILFASTGEKLEDFERFHPDRMASRILGMGDVLSLIEKAEQQVDEERGRGPAGEDAKRDQFTLEDFLQQMRQVRKMGPLSGLHRDAAGDGGDEAAEERRRRRGRARPGRGDHPLDDARRAGQPGADQRLAPQTDRQRLGDQGPARQAAGQAVRPDAQDDEARWPPGKMPTPQQMAQMAGGAARAAPEDP